MSGDEVECDLVDEKGFCYRFTVASTQEANRLQLNSAAAFRKLNEEMKRKGVKPFGKYVGGKVCPIAQGAAAAASEDLKSPAKKKAKKVKKPALEPKVVNLEATKAPPPRQSFATSTPLRSDAVDRGTSNAAEAPRFRRSLQNIYEPRDTNTMIGAGAEAASTAPALTSNVSVHDMETKFSNSLTLDEQHDSMLADEEKKEMKIQTIAETDESEEEDDMLVALKNSSHIFFTKPSAMGLVSFIKMLTLKMNEANFIDLEEEFIVNCSIADGGVMVEFNSCEYANLVMLLDNNINYSGANFKMEMTRVLTNKTADKSVKQRTELRPTAKQPTLVLPSVLKTNSVQSPSVQPTANMETKEEHPTEEFQSVLIQNQDEASAAADNEINLSVNELFSLESDQGTATFIKLLIKHKNKFPLSGSYDTILDLMRRVLIKKNVITTLRNLRDYREKLRNNYTKCKRKGKDNCKHFIALDVAFGVSSTDSLEGTMYDFSNDTDLDLDSEPAPSTSGARKVASWTMSSSKALIGACVDKQEDYDKPIRHSHFWTDIRTVLLEKHGFDYTAQQCEDKVSALRAVYKDLIGDAGTGAEGIIVAIEDKNLRDVMALVHQLIGDSVTVRPKLTVSAGFKSVTKRRSESPRKKHKKSAIHKVVKLAGKKRYLKKMKKSKKPTIAERKVAALELRAASMVQIASHYQKKKAKAQKKVVETSDSDSDSDSQSSSNSGSDDSTE